MDKLDFLDGAEAPIEDAQPAEPVVETPLEPEVAEQPETDATQPRDESGRFAPKVEAQPEPKPEAPPPGYVPIGVVQELRNEIRGLKAQPQQPPPDFFDDQEGYVDQRIMQPVTQQITQLNLNWSKRFAEQSFGAETVNAAEQWVLQQSQIDPSLGQRVIASPDPYGASVNEYKQHQVLSQLSDPSRIDAFLAWEAAQKAAQAEPQSSPQQAQQQTPTRSLASAPSSGGAAHVPTGPGQAFDNLFNQ